MGEAPVLSHENSEIRLVESHTVGEVFRLESHWADGHFCLRTEGPRKGAYYLSHFGWGSSAENQPGPEHDIHKANGENHHALTTQPHCEEAEAFKVTVPEPGKLEIRGWGALEPFVLVHKNGAADFIREDDMATYNDKLWGVVTKERFETMPATE